MVVKVITSGIVYQTEKISDRYTLEDKHRMYQKLVYPVEETHLIWKAGLIMPDSAALMASWLTWADPASCNPTAGHCLCKGPS